MYLYNPVESINHKISERDIYRFDYTFTSNDDFDYFMILLSDGTITYDEEPYVLRLSPTMTLNREIKANKEYSGSIFFNTTNTASSTKPLANQFELHVNSRIRGTINNQVIMTFTRFEIIKIN